MRKEEAVTAKSKRSEVKLPVIDFGENDDQHFKTYLSKSLKDAIQKFAAREGLKDSEAGRILFLIALENPLVFGGYEATNSSRSLVPGIKRV